MYTQHRLRDAVETTGGEVTVDKNNGGDEATTASRPDQATTADGPDQATTVPQPEDDDPWGGFSLDEVTYRSSDPFRPEQPEQD
jgi:hypothetical protein